MNIGGGGLEINPGSFYQEYFLKHIYFGQQQDTYLGI